MHCLLLKKARTDIDFETVTTLPGAGTSSITHNYSAIDDNPYVGVSYYRLKQTDYDGMSTYSNIVPVTYYPSDEIAIGNSLLSTTNSFMQITSKTQGVADHRYLRRNRQKNIHERPKYGIRYK